MRKLAVAQFVKDLARLGVVLPVDRRGLRRRQEFKDAAGEFMAFPRQPLESSLTRS
jgi:hypothetical protein